LVLFVAAFIAVKVISEDKPSVIASANADKIANDMLTALNKPAWDSLDLLRWEFMRGHRYLWDKKSNNAVIEFGGYKVVMDLDAVDGIVYEDGTVMDKEAAKPILAKAWANWCNDSFWMFAPFKVFDKGTKREIVEAPEGKTGLMVTYQSGGVTPGDAYLWFLDENNIPTSYKMWVGVIPIGGMEMTWEDWQTLSGGAKVAIGHTSPALSFEMKDVAQGAVPSDLGYDDAIFDKL